MTVHLSNVDDKLISGTSEPVPQAEVVEPIKEEVIQDESPKVEEAKVQDESPYEVPETVSEKQDAVAKDKDEFGNEVTSQKTYTEEEVNKMMRERFRRSEEGKRQEQQKVEPENSEDWEAQLKGFVKKTFQEMSHEEQQKVREIKEQEAMEKLQDNIYHSMNKYRDFKDVVSKVPMSDYMVKATKSFKDPGAFIYAASKTQGKELERIARLDDPLDQAAEIGKLEEKMRKLSRSPNSPRPVTQVQGDIANRENVRQSVDELIRKDQLKKFQRRY